MNDNPGMVKVGEAVPGGPCGDIWVSETLLAQKGVLAVRQMVRATFEAAYRSEREKREYRREQRGRK